MARLFYYLVQNYGRKKTIEFIQKVRMFHLSPPGLSQNCEYRYPQLARLNPLLCGGT